MDETTENSVTTLESNNKNEEANCKVTENADEEKKEESTEEQTNTDSKSPEKENKTPQVKEKQSLREVDVGITEYVSEHEGFFGIIKQRYSDFLVNELSEDGEEIHLTDKSTIPPPPKAETEPVLTCPSILTPELLLDIKTLEDESVKGKKGAANGSLFVPEKETKSETTPKPEETKEPKEGESENVDKIDGVVDMDIVNNDDDSPNESDDNKAETIKTPEKSEVTPTEEKEKEKVTKKPGRKEVRINVTGLDKAERASVHQYIKDNFKNIVANTTTDEKDNKIIVVHNGKDNRYKSWPIDKRYTIFTLYKENLDTMEAVSILAWRLHINRLSTFGYAGTKDRRGKTSQLVSACQIPPKNLVNAANGYRNNLQVGNFRYSNEQLYLGNLKGNRFQIVLREVKGEDEVIHSALQSLRENGFINYYGMQRFGTTSVPTYSIGAVLIKEAWQEAVDLILKQRDSDTPELGRARKIWCEKKDAAAAYAALGKKKHTVEGALLSGLMKTSKNDFLGAIFNIPAKTRMLYLHAYQSYIWNSVVSKRIEKYGHRVLAGDLVEAKTDEEKPESKAEGEILEAEFIEEFSCQVFPVKDGDKDTTEASTTAENSDTHTKVHVLTEEEAKHESISNVLLPLPGFSMQYPENEIKDWYVELLEKDGLNLEMLDAKNESFSLCGSYRRIIVTPEDVSDKICYYDDSTKPLIASDLDKLNNIDVSENCLEEGKHKALLIDFKLPRSSYATMALRELLKMDTSPQYQSSLNSSDLDMKNRLPWQQEGKNNKNDGKHKNSPRGHRGRGRFGGGNRRGGWNDRGRGWGNPRGGWGSGPRGGAGRGGWGNDRGRGRWPGHNTGRGGWGGDRGGPMRGGRGGPPVRAPWMPPQNMGPGGFNEWGGMRPNMRGGPINNGWGTNRGWGSAATVGGGSFGGPSPDWMQRGGGDRGRGINWRRNNRAMGGRGLGGGRGNKRTMSNDSGFKANKRGRF